MSTTLRGMLIEHPDDDIQAVLLQLLEMALPVEAEILQGMEDKPASDLTGILIVMDADLQLGLNEIPAMMVMDLQWRTDTTEPGMTHFLAVMEASELDMYVSERRMDKASLVQ